MPSVRKSLLQLVFSGAYMKRWNDKLRPVELHELDKQAHKMIVAWALFHLNAERLPLDERLALGETVVEGGLFDYLYRLIITDIKPPVFYQIKDNPDHYRRLTDWVLEHLEPRLQPLGGDFWDRLAAYLSRPKRDDLGSRILFAAHLYASNWEFNLIKGINPRDEEFLEIEQWFANGLREHRDILGVEELIADEETALGRFANLCGRLRFQKRWSQTPRIPETSVLGHMFVVACYAYFFSLCLDACRARRQNGFFSGLFHDLPELLTRDIISPVKKSVQDIADLVKEYERKELRRKVLAPLEQGGHSSLCDRLAYFLGLEVGSEFMETVRVDGRVQTVDFETFCSRYNADEFDPKDGRMLETCDSLAAFIEAYAAVSNGIASAQLQEALWRIRSQYRTSTLGHGVHVGALLADFD